MQAGKRLVAVSYDDVGIRAMALEHEEITEQIIGAAFEVYSILGYAPATDTEGEIEPRIEQSSSGGTGLSRRLRPLQTVLADFPHTACPNPLV
jgi:hypothetical protein